VRQKVAHLCRDVRVMARQLSGVKPPRLL